MTDPSELEQEALAVQAEFPELYGFEHDCDCHENWAEGDIAFVPKCYVKMAGEALATCHKFKGELADRERKLATLRIQVTEGGEEPRV